MTIRTFQLSRTCVQCVQKQRKTKKTLLNWEILSSHSVESSSVKECRCEFYTFSSFFFGTNLPKVLSNDFWNIQDSPPAWTQEAYRSPHSEYSFCCPNQGGYPIPARVGIPPLIPPILTWQGVPNPWVPPVLTWWGYPIPARGGGTPPWVHPPSWPGWRVPHPCWVVPHLRYPLSWPGWQGTPSLLGVPHLGYPPIWTWLGYPPSRPGQGTSLSGPGWGTALHLDLARVPPPPQTEDRWMDGWMDRHVSKHYPTVVLRTWAVNTVVSQIQWGFSR